MFSHILARAAIGGINANGGCKRGRTQLREGVGDLPRSKQEVIGETEQRSRGTQGRWGVCGRGEAGGDEEEE